MVTTDHFYYVLSLYVNYTARDPQFGSMTRTWPVFPKAEYDVSLLRYIFCLYIILS